MEVMSEDGVWARADAQHVAKLLSANRRERRLAAVGRSRGKAYQKALVSRRRVAAAAAKAWSKIAAQLAHEEAEQSRVWGLPIRVRVRPRKVSAAAERRAAADEILARVSRPDSGRSRPIIDHRGRRSVFLRIRYVGRKSKGWREGMAADHISYIARPEALESEVVTNMGANVSEVAAGWRVLEAIEVGYRANAIVQYRMILNLPSELHPSQRSECVKAFCERSFGRLGLPYAAAIHTPDPTGDERNFHAHIVFACRPLERVAPGEWVAAKEKVNGLTDPDGLRLLRAQAAAHLNRACQRAGLSNLYTHQTYLERGLDLERGEHVGAARMAAHRRGERVAAVERNAQRAKSNALELEVMDASYELHCVKAVSRIQGKRWAVRRRLTAGTDKLGKAQAVSSLLAQGASRIDPERTLRFEQLRRKLSEAREGIGLRLGSVSQTAAGLKAEAEKVRRAVSATEQAAVERARHRAARQRHTEFLELFRKTQEALDRAQGRAADQKLVSHEAADAETVPARHRNEDVSNSESRNSIAPAQLLPASPASRHSGNLVAEGLAMALASTPCLILQKNGRYELASGGAQRLAISNIALGDTALQKVLHEHHVRQSADIRLFIGYLKQHPEQFEIGLSNAAFLPTAPAAIRDAFRRRACPDLHAYLLQWLEKRPDLMDRCHRRQPERGLVTSMPSENLQAESSPAVQSLNDSASNSSLHAWQARNGPAR